MLKVIIFAPPKKGQKKVINMIKKVSFSLLVTMMLFMSGCVNIVDPPVEVVIDNNIPEGSFDYSTVKALNMSVYVDDKYNSEYNYYIELLDANPFSNSMANVLNAGVTRGSSPFNSEITISQTITKIYVRQTDPLQRKSVKVVNIEQGSSFICDFRTSSSSSAAAQSITKSDEPVSSKTVDAYLESASSYPLPSTYTTLDAGTTSMVTLMASNYYVPAGVTLIDKINTGWQGFSLYIAGKVVFTNATADFYCSSNAKFVILSGGELVIERAGTSLSQVKVLVAVNEGGKLTINTDLSLGGGYNNANPGAKIINDGIVDMSGKLSMTNYAMVINNGTMNINKIDITNYTKVINHGTLNVDTDVRMSTNNGLFRNNNILIVGGTFSTTNTNCTVENNHYFQATKLDAYNCGINLINNCQIKAQEITIQQGTITCGDGSLIGCEKFTGAAANVTMIGNSMFAVVDLELFPTTEVSFNTTRNTTFTGVQDGTDIPLLIIENVSNPTERNAMSLNGNIQAVFEGAVGDNYLKNIQSGVTLSDEPVYGVDECGCNDLIPETGGEGDDPHDINFPIQVADNSVYTFAMEDRWPDYGDYDMNDVVFQISGFNYTQNSSNEVTQFSFDILPIAAGSTIKTTVCLQFDELTSGSISGFTGVMGSREVGQAKENLTLFPDFHFDAFGQTSHILVNTSSRAVSASSSTYTYTVTFSSPIAKSKLNINKLNFYIYLVNDGTDRKEVHLGGFAPSSKVQSSTYGYIDGNNMVWGIMIPSGNFAYPKESVTITNAYSNFTNWATSFGANNVDWYLFPNSAGVFNL